MDVLAQERPCHDATAGRADESGERRTSRMMMPYSHPPLMRAKKRKGDARRRAAWLVAAGRRFLVDERIRGPAKDTQDRTPVSSGVGAVARPS